MPFPSGRCRTCRARHLKCDEARPTCSRCQKSNRDCAWDDQDENDLLFRDENPFASNNARRQRGGARRKANSPDTALLSKHNELKSGQLIIHGFDIDLHKGSANPACTGPITSQRSLSDCQINESLLDHARARAYASYVAYDGTLSSDIWGYLYRQRSKLFPSGRNTLFDTAFDAFALRFYSSNTGCKEAELVSVQKYADTLTLLQKILRNGSDALQDEVIVAILLLASCEDNVPAAGTKSLLLQGYPHMKGASALFELRQTTPGRLNCEVELDNIVRRRVVRQAIYVGEAIPRSMCEDLADTVAIDVALDILLGKIANLRNQMIQVFTRFESYTPSEIKHYFQDLLRLLNESSAIDEKLKAWHSQLPQEWVYESRNLPDFTYNTFSTSGVFHSKRYDDYDKSGLDVVTSLNRYRAARMLCLGYISRILTEPRFIECFEDSQAELQSVASRLSPHLVTEAVLGYAVGTVRLLTEEIIRSIPTFFSYPEPPTCLTSLNDIKKASPAKLMQLVWPVVIASSITICPEVERQFLKKNIKLIGELSGNKSLKKVADLNLHGSFMQRVVSGKLFYSS